MMTAFWAAARAPSLLLLLLLPQLALSQAAEQSGGLVRLDLSAETPWRLCNANRSIQLPVQLPAHVLGTLAAAGVVQDPLYRDGELRTRWVSEEHWNFTAIWAGSQHAAVIKRRHVLLVLDGVDTFGQVLLNGRHLAATNNAHRSWWLPLPDPARLLRDGANLLSVLLRPAVAVALRDKATYAYDIPTMVVPGGFDVYNFARKPASDFGWDWGPAFAPAGITGGVELLGFDRATVFGALVHQQVANGSCFSLTVTAQLLVPEAGDGGLLTVELPALALASSKQVTLAAGDVGGNPLQALAEPLRLDVPAAAVRLWQPRGLLPPGQTNRGALYDLRVSFTPSDTSCCCSSSSSSSSSGARSRGGSGVTGSGSGHADAPCQPCGRAADSSSSISRRVGFRSVELVRQPIKAAEADLNRGLTEPAEQEQHQQQQQAQQAGSGSQEPGAAAAAATAALVPGSWADVAGFYSFVADAAGVQQQAQKLPPGFAWPDPLSSQAAAVRAAVNALCLGAEVSDAADATPPPAATTVGSDAAADAEPGVLTATGAADKQQQQQQQQQQAAELQQRREQLQELKRVCEAKAADAAARFCAQRPHACSQQLQPAAAELPSQPVPAQEDGESFYFRVNGVPLFAKGANLIPLHVLSTAVGPGDVVQLLRDAAAANINMIRIWGGGRYQIDALYDAADELGLLVWQEAMFACSPYPRDASFLASVESEVTQQLLRLGSHPSIAIWGGNNEVEAALDWYPSTLANPRLFAVDYNELFVGAIGGLVQRFLPGAPWVDSSPSNGFINAGARAAATSDQQQDQELQQPPMTATAAAEAAGGRAGTSVKRWGNPQNPRYGDVHFYNYRDDCQDWRTYPTARFVSEYGWQSYPSWATYSAATAAQDWQLAAPMTEFRQRHPNGTVELLAQLQRRFKLPDSWLDILQRHAAAAVGVPAPAGPPPAAAINSGWLGTLTAAVTATVQGLWRQRQPVLQQHIQLLSGVLSHMQQGMAKILSLARTAGREDAGLAPAAAQPAAGGRQQQQQRQPGASPSSSTASVPAAGAEMRDFVYLTQLQQLLCYDTALSHWRRLRSSPGIHTMGVLYWQLNDLWAGASWSSIDYGGVWKPLQYGVARAFADLSLSMRHDLHNETIQAYVVSDLLQPLQARLTIRLLSLTDPPGACSSSSWKRFEQQVDLVAPPGAAVLGWAGTVEQLLAAAGNGCSRRSCYAHISLRAAPAAGAAAQHSSSSSSSSSSQEATVWLAPFAELQLPDPRIRVSDFRLVDQGADDAAPVGDAALSSLQAEFTVRSDAVAAFAVWELLPPGGLLAGRFSDNALTLHPCEPRRVAFVPREGGDGLSSHPGQAALQQQQQRSQGDDSNSDGGRLLQVLQQQLAVSSLFDHQHFSPEPSSSSSSSGDRGGWRSRQQQRQSAAAVVEE